MEELNSKILSAVLDVKEQQQKDAITINSLSDKTDRIVQDLEEHKETRDRVRNTEEDIRALKKDVSLTQQKLNTKVDTKVVNKKAGFWGVGGGAAVAGILTAVLDFFKS